MTAAALTGCGEQKQKETEKSKEAVAPIQGPYGDQMLPERELVIPSLFEVNDGFFYTQPVTFETEAYVKYRSNLITTGVLEHIVFWQFSDLIEKYAFV